MQVEELTRLLKTVTKGKQKRAKQTISIPIPSSSSSSSSTSSSPSSKSAPSSNSALFSNLLSFLHYEEMNRDQRNTLRGEIVRIMDRLSDDKSLNIKKTFESQRKKVNNIIPVVQKSINKKFFLVTDGVIKHVIHECHRHQWEELLNARRGANWVENDKKGGTQILDKVIPEKSETDEDNLTNFQQNFAFRQNAILPKLLGFGKQPYSPLEEADENQDPPEEDDQAEEDENQEVVDENQEEVEENLEEVDENQEDKEED
ncbi:uncharacterized protein OCT59_004132 [Rhizophagus irregularis]|uniref:uncharacterized protein n=1 Tax=Rhizophagus irregularis TaxID=588596 RepID=UPI0033282521|nr:hypothetical protein OCT59_004132 [Rhizophagus irregularis]